MHDAPLLSVIIPHYNDLDNLRHCLRLLSDQDAAPDGFEIIVADNNSSCGLSAVEAVCGGMARVVSAAIQGAGAARNTGVEHSSGRYLAFLDSDCRPARNWISTGVNALENSPMVGGRVEVVVADPRNPTPTETYELVFAFNNQRYVEEEGFSVTANMFVRREVFASVGGFRPHVPEDKDWGNRAVAMGYKWHYEPAACVSHPARRDWRELTSKWRRLVKESFAEARDRRFGSVRWIIRSWAVVLSSFLALRTVMRSPRLNRFQHKIAASGVLFRLRWWRFIEAHMVLLAK
jgi:glycosyltransferase involved in cell wall biosynthesis